MRRIRGAGLPLVTSIAVLLIIAAPAAAQARGAHCRPGSAGLGDSYYPGAGNGGYDVRHYGLAVSYDPATDRLDGSATIRATTGPSLCSFKLDLLGLEVQSVRVDGRAATWSRDGQELTVTPKQRLARRTGFVVVIRYRGVPVVLTLPGSVLPSGFMPTSDGAMVAGEPDGAATWFPVNDHPIDKATYTFEVTVPDGYEVVANGKPRGREPRPGGRTAWRWEAAEPMASYLATIDIGQWDVHRWRTGAGVPVYDAVDPAITAGFRQQIDSSLARQGEILGLLGRWFGRPYPFNTVGAIVDLERPIGFALETQTRPVYSFIFWLDNHSQPVNADYVVVHELSHQWFGDDIALRRWRDIWLNEGFATYAEWLWMQHEDQATPEQTFQSLFADTPAADPIWSVVIGDPGPEHDFDEAVYVRGAMTLQALRDRIGNRAFWKVIRTWSRQRRGGHGTTRQFIATAESVSGKQLDGLFNTWLFTSGKPASAGAGAAGRRAVDRRAEAKAHAWLRSVRTRLRLGSY
jgi:aminopeptidase N